MNYIGVNCPVCDVTFEKHDDIVVCPQCGTPYHRECYKSEGQCIFSDKHGSHDSVWKDPRNEGNTDDDYYENEENLITCPRCFHKNSSQALFCKTCGRPLKGSQEESETKIPNEYVGAEALKILFDPLGGVDPKEDFDGVSAEDLSKFVGSNSQYYIRNFKYLKDKKKSRLNFAAFFSPGVWLLYRKQYMIGIITLVLYSATTLASLFISEFFYDDVFKEILLSAGIKSESFLTISDQLSILNALSVMSLKKQIIYWLPKILNLMVFIFSFVMGLKANKMYMKFSVLQIKKIKSKSLPRDEYVSELIRNGNVNPAILFYILLGAMAVSTIVTIMS